MVRTKRKTEINLELREAVAIRSRHTVLAHCSRCQRQMQMVAANDAVMITRRSARDIYRQVETGQLHFIEDQRGLLYICAASLQELLEAEKA